MHYKRRYSVPSSNALIRWGAPDKVQRNLAAATGVFSVSEQGVLAYQTDARVSGSQLSWFDRTGKSLGLLGDLARYSNLHLSPDVKRATVAITDPQIRRLYLWLYAVARGLLTRFTFDPATEGEQAWSPDGKSIASLYREQQSSAWRIALIPIEGGQPTKLLDLASGYTTVEITTGIPQGWLHAFEFPFTAQFQQGVRCQTIIAMRVSNPHRSLRKWRFTRVSAAH